MPPKSSGTRPPTQRQCLRPGLPVLVRGPGEVQIGIAHPVVLRGLHPDDQAFLASLEGRRVPLSPGERVRHGPLIDLLAHQGLLGPVTSPASRSAVEVGTIRIRGADRVTAWIALGLALSGVPALSVVDPRDEGRCGSALDQGGASSLRRLLKDSRPTLRWATAEAPAHIEVLRSHGAADLVRSRRLMACDTPHLLVVSDDEGIEVGPLIVPGITACAICLGIDRAEGDPWWPRIALQMGSGWRMAGLSIPPSVALLSAGIAVREILAHVKGDPPTATRWRIAFDSPVPEPRICLPRTDCGCGAADFPASVQAS